MLLRQPGTMSHASVDLLGYEVKSARVGSAFEYQYHRASWQEKFQHDIDAGHLFFSHGDNLRTVKLYCAEGRNMAAEFFIPWRVDCPHATNPSTQRYRCNVPFGWVTSQAQLVMKL